MGPVSRTLKVKALWQLIPPPAPIPDGHHLHRQVRYIALNPCRKGLCQDPLEWQWSTYRDLFGASAYLPQNSGSLASALGRSNEKFLPWLHKYVSEDSSVKVTGTSLPKLSKLNRFQSLQMNLLAAASALNEHPNTVKNRGSILRRLFIHFGYKNGWKRRPELLAELCQTSPRSIHRILKEPTPQGLAEAQVCLSDARFTSHWGTLWALNEQKRDVKCRTPQGMPT